MPNVTKITITYDDGTIDELDSKALVARLTVDGGVNMEFIGLSEEEIQGIGETLADPDGWEDIDYV